MQREKVTWKQWCSGLFLVAAAVLLAVLSWHWAAKNYYLVSLIVLTGGMGAFFLSFEREKPPAQELVLLAVLCAVTVAGRMVFAAVPFFKPVTALIILAGAAFGGRAGFLCGAMSLFVSNFYFGQGAWTPWQMFAYGLAGLLAGVIFRPGRMPRKRIPMALFGAVCVLFPVGPLLDTSTLFLMAAQVTPASAAAVYLAGLPVNGIHAGATAFFLFVAGPLMLEKLDRVQLKYGLERGEGALRDAD